MFNFLVKSRKYAVLVFSSHPSHTRENIYDTQRASSADMSGRFQHGVRVQRRLAQLGEDICVESLVSRTNVSWGLSQSR
jgi:hypothetical protein